MKKVSNERKFGLNNNIIESYLGDFSPEKFESENEICNYFSWDNLVAIFPEDKIDLEEVERVKQYCIAEWKSQPTPTHFVVKTAAARMPSSCWGQYGRVAVLECEHWQDNPSMISTHARGVVRIVETWERLNRGRTERCAFRRALADAEDLCAQLNANR